MSNEPRFSLRPTLGAWAPLLLVAETACEALGVELRWKTVSVSGDAVDEYLSLMAATPDTVEGRALRRVLSHLEATSEMLDPTTGRPRSED